MNRGWGAHRQHRMRGFTLVEIVVVLIIVSVLIAMAAVMTRGVVAAQKRTLTASRMAAIEAAFVQFVSQQKRLPCPADGTQGPGTPNLGIEGPRNAGNGCTGNQQDGIVPFRALGLTETDATDGWDRRLTYRVAPLLAADNGMDMTWCDAAGTGAALASGANFVCNGNAGVCTTATIANCTSPINFLTNNNGAAGKGLQVRNLAGQVLMNPTPGVGNVHTGAAYVVISHGESGGGGYLVTGTLGASTIGDGTEELKNYASLPYVNAVTYYVDDSTNDAAGNAHFDDILLRPSVLAVATKSGLGPRVH